MTHGSHYLGKLYNDLIANSPQTISIDIPSDMGKGRIAQTQIKHGIIFSDWQMCYQSDMNVQGKYSLQGTTQGRYLTGGVPPVRFSM